jgi:hypothetical protein
MFVSLGDMSELAQLGLVRGLRPYYTVKLKAGQRLIVGWNLECCQYIKFSCTTPYFPIGPTLIHASAGTGPFVAGACNLYDQCETGFSRFLREGDSVQHLDP